MNKKKRLPVLILVCAILLSACGAAKGPQPSEQTGEYAENSVGRRFNFTLQELNDRIDSTLSALSDVADKSVTAGEWEVLEQGLTDNSGVKYTSYCVHRNRFTLTAAVEDDSKKVMNVGCGCRQELLEEQAGRRGFLTLSAVLAEQAGGFADADIPFLRGLIAALLDGEEDELYYEGLLCSRSEDRDTVVVILSPCGTARARRDGVKTFGN